MSLFTTTLTMFLIMNSVGSIIIYLDLVEIIDQKRRRLIVIREMFIALVFMLFFLLVGKFLLAALEIGAQTVSLAGGLILFLIAIRMIFPQSKPPIPPSEKVEPFIVPIATPMIAGPSILTTIMLYAHQHSLPTLTIAVLTAWGFSITILFFAHNIKDIVGKRTLLALERLMGLLLTMMAVEMFLKGIKSLMQHGIA